MASGSGLGQYDHERVAHFIGGNPLANAPSGKVTDFVKAQGGHSVITKVLIANNGIAAVKEIRSIRKWAYETFGDERAIEFTVMATPEDLRINAEYIRMADRYVEVPGGSNNNNYANVDFIVDVAERAGVHAVWAGWGHASENPRLPETLAKSKIIFIGPPGSAMRSLGDKISSTIVAQHAQVPCMAWSGTGISDTCLSDQGFVTVPDEAYKKACITSWEEGLEKSEAIGWPVMIKASEGGGGKGIRMVDAPEKFKQAFLAVASEVPGSPIFIMKLAGSARHLEVQLIADQYGNAISLFGRDCSVQRRHQKIIEEAPVTIARPEKFEEMEKAAVRLAKLVGYVSAGTVEYLYSHSDDSFYFLELNPRLQVEHPTTEMVSGCDIPSVQLQIAMGLPLHRIRDIRTLYGLDPHSATEIDFDGENPDSANTQRKPRPKGHVVACRITGENPDAGFKPSSGNLTELNFRSNSNVWGYFSVSSAGGLHEYADSQFGHIFAYGMERSEARKSMVVALKELSIRGEFRTTVEYLIKLLEKPEFENNTLTTQWLDGLIAEGMTSERPDATIAVVCGAVVKAHVAYEASMAGYKAVLEKGQVPSRESLQTFFKTEFIYENVRYSFAMAKSSPNSFTLYLNGGRIFVGARSLSDGGLLISLEGASHTVYYREEVGALVLSIDAKTCMIEDEQDPTQLRSPSPGKLVRYLIDSGDHVDAGEAYAEIEVMKMILPVTASESGIAQFMKQPGQTLASGELLGILTLDDPTKVKFAKPFEGILPDFELKHGRYGSRPHQRLREHLEILYDNLAGFDNSASVVSSLKIVESTLADPHLPYANVNDVLSTLSGRMPAKLEEEVRSIIDSSRSKKQEFPSPKLRKAIDFFIEDSVAPKDRTAIRAACFPLQTVVDSFDGGLKAHEWQVYADLLNAFADVEEPFAQGKTEQSVVLKLREDSKDTNAVVKLVLSHSKVALKTKLVLAVLDLVKSASPRVSAVADKKVNPALRRLAALDSRPTTKVALRAREVLVLGSLPTFEEREVQMEKILRAAITTSYYGEGGTGHRLPSTDVLKEVTDSRYTVYDVLHHFFDHEDPWVALAALETYVRRAYRVYNVQHLDYEAGETGGDPHIVTWRFKMGLTSSEPMTPRSESSRDVSRVGSMSDLSYVISRNQIEPVRFGVMSSFKDFATLEASFGKLLGQFPSFSVADFADRHGKDARHPNVLNIALQAYEEDGQTDDELMQKFTEVANANASKIVGKGIRRATLLICRKGQYPWYFTLRAGPDGVWREEQEIRNIEPALAYQLELGRLSNFKITPTTSSNRQIHVYHAVGRENTSDIRFFVRSLLRPGLLRGSMKIQEYLISETDRLVNDILDTLEIVGSQHRQADCNHISVNCVHNLPVTFDDVQEALAGFIERHGKRLWRLRVTQAEIRIVIEDEDGNVTPIRAFIENVSGFVVKYEAYQEVTTDKGNAILKSIGPQGQFHLQKVNFPYTTKESLQPKRYQAHIVGTTYVYDFPDLFRQAVRRVWEKTAETYPGLKEPTDFLTASELVLDEHRQLQEVPRAPGLNNCGMVGWIFTIKTPEYPKGRRIVVVSNDITYQIGSFGPVEDEFFFKVTELARSLGLPRIYLSANSGARIGLAEEIIGLFSAAWNEEGRPEKGFQYLYLTPENLAKLKDNGAGSVKTNEIEVGGERRHQITDIIGLKDGLGVECLRGSGLIAGETARAYDDIFTISLVSARSVGIGAYLLRLGQRTVQVEGQPIILTGAPALNKVLGREVYTSNLQLGGTQIMYKNGVSHLTAQSDLEGALQIVQWLSYVPERKGKAIPIFPSGDPWDRTIDYLPPKGPYDPRWFIGGKMEEMEAGGEQWLSGFFDKGSFQETLGGWAQTVVIGRARLGGIPMGVIAVETRTIERVVPADPANPASFEQKLMEAGQVWYPNSAYKTAQAIFDLNREGLPLIIFANWRGFSGGQQDMYDEILKQGSKIVDGLSAYKQPVFVYIVPNGELRGGAWVVLDPSINPEHMEMYADKEARGGVLEPEGIVEIKYRRDKVLATMNRLDSEYARLKAASLDAQASAEAQADAKEKLAAREKHLMPTYQQIALLYSDLHDRAGRMEAKGCARAADWPEARRFFYWRLRRRLNEQHMLSKLATAHPGLTSFERKDMLSELVEADSSSDQAVAQWIEGHSDVIVSYAAEMKSQYISDKILEFAETDRDGTLAGFTRIMESLSEEERKQLVERFSSTSSS